jgi:predicted ATPase/class 3 adenylate cyclase
MLPTGTVTFLFTDIQGSTPLWEREPEKMAAALQTHNAILRQAIEEQGGVIFKTVGDAFQAAFSTAPRALSAAIAGQEAMGSAAWNELGELKVRIGLHTGEAELDPAGDEYTVSHTKNRAARIMSAAHGGQILLSQETADLVLRRLPEAVSLKDLGNHRLKGLTLPEHIYQVCARGLPLEFPPLVTTITHPHNLPLQLTSFIGREREIGEVVDLVGKNRLVTLTGSGGVGKTRLSIRAAENLIDQFPDGIWFVELARLADPSLLVQTIAQTIGLREDSKYSFQDVLTSFLRNRRVLIVLDNCEHLLEACAEISADLLKGCPQVKLLTSSREALGIAGERTFLVPALNLPSMEEIKFDQLQDYDAVKLFIARAQEVLPVFRITPENAHTIARICQRLDGVPLALEMAAARMNMLTTEQLVSRLDNAFRLLTGGSRTALPHHQTLQAVIDWSYQLLDEPERKLIRRLSVFAGNFSLEGAEHICAIDGLDDWEILDLLASLVDKSIVNVDRELGGETRYYLLEIVRQYMRHKLYDAGESEQIRDRHLSYYATLTEEAYPHIHGAGRLEWTARLKWEYDNLREALEWAFKDSTQAYLGLEIAINIADRFWATMGITKEGENWLRSGLQAGGEAIPELLSAKATCYLCRIGNVAAEEWQACIRQLRAIGPEAQRELALALAWSESRLSWSKLLQFEETERIARGMGPAGSWALAEVLFRKSISILLLTGPQPGSENENEAYAAAMENVNLVQSGDRWHPGGYWILGIIHTRRGQLDQARRKLQKALDLQLEVDDNVGIFSSLFWLAWHYRQLGQTVQALRYCQDMPGILDWLPGDAGYLLYTVGMVLGHSPSGESVDSDHQTYYDSLRLLALQDKIRTEDDWRFIYDQNSYQQLLRQLRRRLGEAIYQKFWEEGQAMSLEEGMATVNSLLERYTARIQI